MTDSKSENNYYHEVSESIKSVFDLTSRIDERIKLIIKKQDQMERKLDERLQAFSGIEGRVHVLEAGCTGSVKDLSSLGQTVHTMEMNLQQVQFKTAGHENRWKTIVSFAMQIAWVILAAYLLVKIGIQAPIVP